MESQPPSNTRPGKWINLFNAFVDGKRNVINIHNAKQFFSAVEAYSLHNSPGKCVEAILSHAKGISVLEVSVRISLDPAFISSTTMPFIKNFSDPKIELLNDGGFLQEILFAILIPKTFWDAILDAYGDGKLDGPALEVFMWICLKVVSIRDARLNDHVEDVKSLMQNKPLLHSSSQAVRSIIHRITRMIRIFGSDAIASTGESYRPGGRHDNDLEDFRKISIHPTTDELVSSEEPYLQRLHDVFQVPMEDRARVYRDWLYRLLREDMLAELRQDLRVAINGKQSQKKPKQLSNFELVDISDEDTQRVEAFTLYVQCGGNNFFPHNVTTQAARKEYLEKAHISLHSPSIGALCCDKDIIAFGSLVRTMKLLSMTPPVVGMKFKNSVELTTALSALQSTNKKNLQFIVVDTPIFAYEPILERLKDIGDFPLEEHIVNPLYEATYQIPSGLASMVEILTSIHEKKGSFEIPKNICATRDIILQGAQLESLINGLKEELAQIQGPPGTGKSFIGALIILIMIRLTDYRVLVLSYTNHALDQFEEELLEIGVRITDIVRLGSKATALTEPTLLKNVSQQKGFWLTLEEKYIVKAMKEEILTMEDQLRDIGARLSKIGFQANDILEHLKFSDHDPSFWQAFQVPQLQSGFQFVGAKNKTLRSEDLFNNWAECRSIKPLEAIVQSMDSSAATVWELTREERETFISKWCQEIRHEQIEEFVELSTSLNHLQTKLQSVYDERDRKILRNRRVIACTTTAAAKYQSIIRTADPHVILVEEAGEILEAHIITAMSASVKQLILIGDHKQLRPKINNFKLSKEKGEGYDLNVSLFERLILQGHRFTTLQEQHRSHPDISHFSRILAYPELKDVPKTRERESILGLTSRISFVNHENHEEEMKGGGERWDPTSKSSKRNHYEAKMVMKLVKYLGQQGYKSNEMVVLTPYLGQLFLLREMLRTENDPYLNDLDSYDLVCAGLMSKADANVDKKSLRLSTIDNYQGEECDIVIVSLTLSNASGDIGFLSARERLVVLMSRAKKGMVLFGNMFTFIKSKKGGAMWGEYFGILRDKKYLYDGVPVACQRHPEITRELKKPEDFDKYCPDGGCAEPCKSPLICGQHFCKLHCHLVKDHSKIRCGELIETKCQRGHRGKILCANAGAACNTCIKEDAETRRRISRDLELEKKRLENQERYKKDLEEIEDKIAHEQLKLKADSETKQQDEALKKKQEELKSLREFTERVAKVKIRKQNQKQKAAQPSTPVSPEVSGADSSKARSEWGAMKTMDGSCNAAIDTLMGMVGLESIKRRFLSVKSSVDTKIRQGLSPEDERYSCTLLGNPGTGKTTVARIWGKFLTTVGAIPGDVFEETTGSKLASKGIPECEKLLEKIKNAGGGVLFIDEAYQLSSGNNPGGAAVMDFLLAEIENLRGKVVFALAGYSKQMESFFQHNEGFASRFPIGMKFEDYTDDELHSILRRQISEKFGGRMKVEGGSDGLFFRIASRRIGYGRGKQGFGNARAVENFTQVMLERQADRLRTQRLAGSKSDDLLLTREDIIGPEPSSALTKSEAYQKLSSLIGLKEVKDSLKALMDTVKTNYERELAEEPLVEFSLNRVFVGNPGTGKTTVAKYFAQVLVDIGLLSNGEVIIKCPSDFVGAHLGQSEAQTKGILASTIGKVLVIDEAYGLYGGDHASDPYKTAVIDTIVNEVQSVPGEDRCVLLLGYKDEMERLFQNVNPGLSRRFPLSSAFSFEDFDDQDLSKILELKLKGCGFGATSHAKKVALEVLRRARNRPNFGNAGEVEILLGRAKESHQKRVSAGQVKRKNTFEACDFDPEFNRSDTGTDIQKLFEGETGRQRLIALLEGYQKRVRDAKVLDIDPGIPFNFLFRGPPGTGKTTTARKMGKVYYDMGFLSSAEVIECSATDLIGSYVGHTGPKVQKQLEKALGKILFIDEAYRLSNGQFAKEAVDEIIDCVTKPKYYRKLIIIMAGYEKDINSLLSINPGMSSRFPETVEFHSFEPIDCMKLMTEQLRLQKKKLESKKRHLNMNCLEYPSATFTARLLQQFSILSKQDGWANARDVLELASRAFGQLDLSRETMCLSEELVNKEVEKMKQERMNRMSNKTDVSDQLLPTSISDNIGHLSAYSKPQFDTQTQSKAKVSTNTQKHEDEDDDEDEESGSCGPGTHGIAIRDSGVSDAVWEQLQRDKGKEEAEEATFQQLLEAQKTAREADRERILRELMAEDERRKKIEAKRAKLKHSGLCPVGYAWIKQQGGFRCAGGSHWIADAELERL